MSIEIANESGVEVDEPALVELSRHVLDRMRVNPLAELSLLLVDVPTMTRLHVQWMDEPGPTDVLSFAMDELQLLCTHGVLHLLGYDHGDAEEHAEMFGLQGELLSSWHARGAGA